MRVASGNFFGRVLRKLNLNGFVVAEATYASALRIERHAHEKPYLSSVLAGGYIEYYRHGSRTCSAGTVLYHPLGEIHEDIFGRSGGHLLSLEIPEKQSRAAQEIQRHDRNRQAQLRWLMKQLHKELELNCVLSVESILIEISAALACVTNPLRKKPKWYRAAIEILHDRLDESLSLAAVASELGIHPVSLARGFRHYHGCTIGEFVRTLRVNFVREQLTQTAASVAEIAQRAGFADQSHLCRIFKRRTRMTPSEFRVLVR